VSRRDDVRLADVIAAADAIASHLDGGGLDDGLVFDAARRILSRMEPATGPDT